MFEPPHSHEFSLFEEEMFELRHSSEFGLRVGVPRNFYYTVGQLLQTAV
jgi:hypothetical protein